MRSLVIRAGSVPITFLPQAIILVLRTQATPVVPLGEIGGVFAKENLDAYFADTHLSSFYSLNDSLSAAGKFDFQNVTRASGGWADNDSATASIMLGYFSQSAATGRSEFLGFEFRPSDNPNTMSVRANYYVPDLSSTQDSSDFDVTLGGAGNHTFTMTYTPNANTALDNTLSLTIDGTTTLTATITNGATEWKCLLRCFWNRLFDGQKHACLTRLILPRFTLMT